MRFIALHSDFIEFKPVSKALKTAEEVPKEMEKYEECLVVLTAVEKRDEETGIAKKAAQEIKDIAEQVKTKNIVLYPWVHLSSSPSSPKEARRILNETENELKNWNIMFQPLLLDGIRHLQFHAKDTHYLNYQEKFMQMKKKKK